MNGPAGGASKGRRREMAGRGILWLGLLLGFVFVSIAAVVNEWPERVMWLAFGGQAALIAVTSAVFLRHNTGSRNQSNEPRSEGHVRHAGKAQKKLTAGDACPKCDAGTLKLVARLPIHHRPGMSGSTFECTFCGAVLQQVEDDRFGE
jgi:hypothetical protein